jgi:hypothetical protein
MHEQGNLFTPNRVHVRRSMQPNPFPLMHVNRGGMTSLPLFSPFPIPVYTLMGRDRDMNQYIVASTSLRPELADSYGNQ